MKASGKPPLNGPHKELFANGGLSAAGNASAAPVRLEIIAAP